MWQPCVAWANCYNFCSFASRLFLRFLPKGSSFFFFKREQNHRKSLPSEIPSHSPRGDSRCRDKGHRGATEIRWEPTKPATLLWRLRLFKKATAREGDWTWFFSFLRVVLEVWRILEEFKVEFLRCLKDFEVFWGWGLILGLCLCLGDVFGV